MKLLNTPLSQVVVVEFSSILDLRGDFSRLYCEQELAEIIGNRRIVQVNRSRTQAYGAIRGMHYQRPPYAEMKLIRCTRGRVWDVAVDLRQGSPTFLKWYAEELTPDNGRMLVIPEGCAHGFQALEKNSEMLYLHTAFYAPSEEGRLAYNDPRLSIAWPLPVTDISVNDQHSEPINLDFIGLKI